MKTLKSKKKLFTFFTLGISLLSVFVASIATFTWYQLDSQPLANEMISSSPNIIVDNSHVYGYKVNPTLGANGQRDDSNTTVTRMASTAESEIATGNDDQDVADTNFDVPSEGIGYYLIKKNPTGTFKYKYNDVSYATKLVNEYETATRAFATVSFYANDVVRVKKYTFVNNQTVNTQIKITSVHGASATIDNDTKDVTIVTGGTYKVWLDYDTGTLGFEPSTDVDSLNIASLRAKTNESINQKNNPSIRREAVNDKSNVTQSGFSDYTLKINIAGNNDNAYWKVWNGSSDIEVYSSGTNWENSNVGSIFPNSDTTIYVKRCNPSNHGQTWNEWAISGVNKNKNNYIEITKWQNESNPYSLQTKSVLTINYVNASGGASIQSTTSITCWNKDSIQTSTGWVASPSITGYTFTGWYTAATGGSVATTNAYIVANANIYARFTVNSPSATTYRTYLYDTTNNWNNETVKAHAWGSNILDAEISPSTTVTYSGHKLYTFDISISYTGFDFYGGTNTSGNQTVDLTKNDATDKYYVLTNNVVDGKYSCHWYGALASETLNTYYYYDNSSTKKLGNSPSAYVWNDSAISLDTETYTLYPARLSSWPGTSMTAYASWTSSEKSAFTTAHPNVDTSNVWRIQASESYDKIIFDKGAGASSETAGDQTIDLTATGNNGKFFVLTGATIPSGPNAGKWDGDWASDVFGVTLKASFFITDNSGTEHVSTYSTETLGQDHSFGIEKYYAPGSSEYNTAIPKTDTVNAVYYNFERISAGTWYTDSTCESIYTPTKVLSSTILYAKYLVDLRNYKTFYIDASHSDTTNHSEWKWTGGVHIMDSSGSAEYFAGYQVAPDLYKATLPNNWMIKLTNGAGGSSGPNWAGGGNDGTSAINLTSVTQDLLHINKCGDGNNHTITWCDYSESSNTKYGTASIQKYNGSWQEIARMSVGDGSNSNYFVYEHGLQIASGTKVRVVVSGSGDYNLDGTYNWSKYVDTKPIYIAQDGTDIKINNSVITGTARFNFYLTSTKKISIAMVPDAGNGYYIMNYNSTYGFENYIGATKMNTGSTTNATYTGFYASSTTKIFIRSYIDAVDVLYKNGASGTGFTINNSTGLIEFSSAGYYNIFVTNGVITIEQYQVSDFFKLNPLDRTASKIKTRSSIYAQKTSLILEVPFTSNNTYKTKVSMNVDLGNLNAFIGTALYVSSSRISENDPATVYNTIRGASSPSSTYSALSNASSINDTQNVIINANTATTYYAYILIDYLPTDNGGVYTNFTTSSFINTNISFYLKGYQYIPA